MVSMNLDPQAQGFHLDTSSGMPLPGINPLQAVSPLEPAAAAAVGTSGSGLMAEDPSKKVRKPYTIKKSRESWSEQEHDKFLEALQLFMGRALSVTIETEELLATSTQNL